MKRRILALTIALLMMAQPVIYSAEEVPELCGVVLEGGIADAPVDVGGVTLEGGGLLLEDGGSGILPDDESGLILDGLSDAAALTNGDDGLAGNDAAPVPDAPGAETPFAQTVALDGLEFTVTAGTGAFPADAALRVEAVDESAALPVSQSADSLMGEAASHHVLSIAVLDGAGNPLQPNPALELPVVHVDGMTGSMRVFAYDQNAQSSLEIETENYEFRLVKSGIYDIAEVARDEMPSGDEQAQPDAPTPADGQPAEDGAGALLPAEDLQLDAAGSDPLMQLEAIGGGDQSLGLDGLGQDGSDLSIEGIEMAGENGEDSQPDQLEVNLVAFEQSKTVNGVVVTVKADPGVFPGNAVLSVKRVPTARRKDANAAIEEVRDDAQNVAVSYSFDIKVIDPDTNETLQPAGGQTVSVSFALSEVADENLETNVYHVTQDEATGELTAQSLDVSQTVTQTTGEETTAVVETDGFSIYTVEFTYNDMEYVMPGDTSVQMSAILDALGLTGDVTAVKVSDERLFSASEENGAWIVTAHQAFTSTEWMKVTINEVVYKITVTDSQDEILNVTYISADGSKKNHNAIKLTKDMHEWTATAASQTDGWYVVNSILEIEEPITVNGYVNLILTSPHKLIAKKGITISEDSFLIINAQDTDSSMGSLVANTVDNGAGITLERTGTFIIDGGHITATGNGGGAGINAKHATITINGGLVEANGSKNSESNVYGAGIAGNSYSRFAINGGKVLAFGSQGISRGVRFDSNSDILSVGKDMYVYDCEDPDEKKWTAIDIIDGFYDRYQKMAIYNKVPELIAEHTVREGTTPMYYYNVNTPISQWMLKGGTLKLHKNLTATNGIALPGQNNARSYTLDPNGFGLVYGGTDASAVITVNSGSTLTLKDSNPTKSHKYKLTEEKVAVNIDVSSGSNSTFTGGYITGGKAGGVCVNGGKFIMSAGTIIGNRNDDGYGGGVVLSTPQGEFVMSGGTIIGNQAALGSGVYMSDGTFYMSGTPVIADNCNSNVYLTESKKIDISQPMAAGASVFVTMPKEGVFTRGYSNNNSEAPSTYFKSDTEAQKVLRNAVGSVIAGEKDEAKLGEHTHEYRCSISPNEDAIIMTCGNNDCGHDGDLERSLGITIPEDYVYGKAVNRGDFLDEGALAAFNRAYKYHMGHPVTAENNLYFFNAEGYKPGVTEPLQTMPTAAGAYVVVLKIATMNSRTGYFSIQKNYEISPKPLTIKNVSISDKSYDGFANAVIKHGAATLEGIVGSDVVNLDKTGAKAVFVKKKENADPNGGPTDELEEDKNAGTDKPVKVDGFALSGDEQVLKNYTLAQPFILTATISRKPVTLVWDEKPLYYNKALQHPKANIKEGDLVGDDVCGVDVSGGQIIAGENYVATATEPTNPNYALPTDERQLKRAFAILPKPVELEWGETSLVYNGQEQHPTVTVNGVVQGDTCTATVDGAATNASQNSYTAEVTGLSNPNYALPKETTQPGEPKKLERAFTISPLTAALKWENTTVVYDGMPHCPTATVSNLVSGETCTVTVTGEQTVVGTHTATAESLSNSNYALPAENTKVFEIHKYIAELEWSTATEFPYDGKDHAPTVTVKNLIQGEKCEVTVEGARKDAGSYTATATALSNPNYGLPTSSSKKTKQFTITPKTVGIAWTNTNLTYNRSAQNPTATATGLIEGDTCTVKLTVGQTNVGSYTATATGLSSKNYALPTAQDQLSKAFTISPKPVGLSWSNTSLTYNGTDMMPTAKATGVVSGDSCTLTVSGAQKNVGSYTAKVTALSNSNYVLPKEVAQTFAINPKTVGLDWGNGVFVYDGAEHCLDATATGLIEGDTCTVTVTGAAKDAGKHTATASALSNGNYALPTANTKDFNIARVTAELEWGASAFTYDGQDHAPTATVKNLVKGDTCTVTVTGSKKDAGSYTATASELSNGNYALPSTKTQKYTISKKTVGLAWSDAALTYTGKNQTPTATATGVAEGDTCNVTVSGAQKNVGGYTATATGLSNKNYALPDASDASANLTQAFTIGRKTAELTWSNTSLTYNGKEQAPTVKVTGLFSGDTCTATVTGGATNVGSYTATAAGLSNANYALPTTVTQAFTIAPKAVGLKWANTSFTYDGASHVPTATATGLASGDACAVTVDGAAVNAGSYTATATGLSNGNYGLPENITQAFTIAQKAAKVTASNQTINEGGEIDASAATLTDAVEGHALKSVKLTADGTKITPSDAVIVDAAGGDMTANYKISYVTGKLTVVKPTTAPTAKPTTAPTEAPIVGPIKVRIDVKDCKVTVKNQTYTGKKLTPKVKVRLDKAELVQGKDFTVTYKNNINVGVATVIVKGKGLYTASRKVTFKILPKRTGFTRLTGGNRAITLEWKQPKNITGYQIQYALNGKMTRAKPVNIGNAGTRTTTVTGLAPKTTYYVRIRTYKRVGKKTYYSKWSGIKKVTTA